MSTNHLPALDALRGIAVIGVITVHTASFTMSLAAPPTGVSEALSNLFASGRMGVELFFILSGFLMGWLYWDREFSVKRFFQSRFLRIWPLWATFSIIWFCIFALQDGELRLTALLLSLTFLLWVSPSDFDTFIGGAWSIQIEVVAYILFATLRKFGLNALIATAIIVNVLGSISSFADLSGYGVLESIRRLSLQTGLNFFVLGVVVASALIQSRKSQSQFSWTSIAQLKLKWTLVWLVSFLLTPAIYGNPVEALGFVGLSVLFVSVTRVQGNLRRALAWLGKHSYFLFFAHFVGLYLMQQAVNTLEISKMSATLVALLTPIAIVLFVAAMSPLAWLSMRFIEGPILSLRAPKSPKTQ